MLNMKMKKKVFKIQHEISVLIELKLGYLCCIRAENAKITRFLFSLLVQDPVVIVVTRSSCSVMFFTCIQDSKNCRTHCASTEKTDVFQHERLSASNHSA